MMLPLIESREEVLRRRGLAPLDDAPLAATFEPAGLDLEAGGGLPIPADVGPRLPPGVTEGGTALNLPEAPLPISVARAQALSAARFDPTARGPADPVAIARAQEGPALPPPLGQQIGGALLTGLRVLGRFIDAAKPGAGELALKQRDLARQEKADRLQALKLGVDAVEGLAKITPSARAAAFPLVKPLLKASLSAAGLEADDTLLEQVAATPGAASAYAAVLTDQVGAAQAAKFAPFLQDLPPNQQVDEIFKLRDRLAESRLPRIQQQIQDFIRRVKANPDTARTVGFVNAAGAPQVVSADVFQTLARDAFGADPLDAAAFNTLATDPKFAPFWQSLGLTPPSVELEGAKAAAVETAKEGTAGGQLGLAEKRVGIATKERELPLAGTKTVPGQGGLLVGPAAAGGGVTKLVETPGAGLDRTSTTQILSIEEALRSAETIQGILKNQKTAKDVTPFIGPTLTGARLNEFLSRQVPGVDIPQALVDVGQAEQVLTNLRIVFRTGASVRETEEPRLLAEIPDRTRDKLAVYERKLTNTIENLRILDRRQKAFLALGGRERLTDEVAGRVLERNPFRFSAAGQPTRRVTGPAQPVTP